MNPSADAVYVEYLRLGHGVYDAFQLLGGTGANAAAELDFVPPREDSDFVRGNSGITEGDACEFHCLWDDCVCRESNQVQQAYYDRELG
jgi:hypothetical protein